VTKRHTVEPPPSKPVSADVVASEAPPADVATRDDVVAVTEAERVGGVSLQLDIAVERRRWLWWHLALRLVARRLR
jgi:hypothetical protein